MSLMNCTFTVRWSGRDGVPHHKSYDSETEARRAKQWLLDNGALSVDIAVRVNNKIIGDLGDKKKPVKATEADQKGFFGEK